MTFLPKKKSISDLQIFVQLIVDVTFRTTTFETARSIPTRSFFFSTIFSIPICFHSKSTVNRPVPVNGPIYMDVLPNNSSQSRGPHAAPQIPGNQILHTYMDTSQNNPDLVNPMPAVDNEPVAYAESQGILLHSGRQGDHPAPAEEYAYAYDHCSKQSQVEPR